MDIPSKASRLIAARVLSKEAEDCLKHAEHALQLGLKFPKLSGYWTEIEYANRKVAEGCADVADWLENV